MMMSELPVLTLPAVTATLTMTPECDGCCYPAALQATDGVKQRHAYACQHTGSVVRVVGVETWPEVTYPDIDSPHGRRVQPGERVAVRTDTQPPSITTINDALIAGRYAVTYGWEADCYGLHDWETRTPGSSEPPIPVPLGSVVGSAVTDRILPVFDDIEAADGVEDCVVLADGRLVAYIEDEEYDLSDQLPFSPWADIASAGGYALFLRDAVPVVTGVDAGTAYSDRR